MLASQGGDTLTLKLTGLFHDRQRKRLMNKWMVGGAAGLACILGVLVFVPTLQTPPASAAGPVGSLDPVPTEPGSPESDSRSGRLMQRKGAPAQALAQIRFDALVKTIRSLDPADVNLAGAFYTAPRYSGYPGLCAADEFTIDLRYQPALRVRTVYRLVGSTDAPSPDINPAKRSAFDQYVTRATANCAARTASRKWFAGDSAQDSWNAVHLFDGMISAARSRLRLTFEVRCAGPALDPSHCRDPRSTLAALDPRDISVLSTDAYGREGAIERTTTIVPHHRKRDLFRIMIRQTIPDGPGLETKATKTVVELEAPGEPIT